MPLVAFIYWKEVTPTSSSVLSKFIPLSSHKWSITLVEFWWGASSSLAFLSSIFSSFILLPDPVSVSFFKENISFDERLVWTLIQGMFEFPKIISLLYIFRSSYLILLTCEITVVHLLLIDLEKTFRPCFRLDDVNAMTIYSTFP